MYLEQNFHRISKLRKELRFRENNEASHFVKLKRIKIIFIESEKFHYLFHRNCSNYIL